MRRNPKKKKADIKPEEKKVDEKKSDDKPAVSLKKEEIINKATAPESKPPQGQKEEPLKIPKEMIPDKEEPKKEAKKDDPKSAPKDNNTKTQEKDTEKENQISTKSSRFPSFFRWTLFSLGFLTFGFFMFKKYYHK